MTQEEIAVFKQSILDAIENYVNIKLSDLPTMKSDIAVVLGNGTKEGNKLKIRNAEYDNIMSVGNIVFPENSIVYTLAPNGQYNQLFILGQLSDTPANIVGGTIDIGNGAFTVDEDGNVDVTGTVNFSDKLLVDNQGNLRFVNGSINIGNKFLVTENGDVVIREGVISLGNGKFFVNNEGQVTINDGSINIGNGNFVVGTDGYLISNGFRANGDINIHNGEVNKINIGHLGWIAIKDNSNVVTAFLDSSGFIYESDTGFANIGTRGVTAGRYYADKSDYSGQPFRLYGGMITSGYTTSALNNYLTSGNDDTITTWGTTPCFYMFVSTSDGGTTKHTVITVPSTDLANYTLDVELNSQFNNTVAFGKRTDFYGSVYFNGIGNEEGHSGTERHAGTEYHSGTEYHNGDETHMSVESHLGTCYHHGTERYYNTVYDATGGTVFTSDRNAKHDIESLDLKESADFIMAQNPVKYRFNEELSNSNRYHHGFIAQEVKETMGESDWGVYIDQTIKDDDNDDINYTKGLRYNEFIADLVATCQYQQKEIEQQQEKIDDLQSQINELKSLIQNQNKNEEE